jgi:hypothetical protein
MQAVSMCVKCTQTRNGKMGTRSADNGGQRTTGGRTTVEVTRSSRQSRVCKAYFPIFCDLVASQDSQHLLNDLFLLRGRWCFQEPL